MSFEDERSSSNKYKAKEIKMASQEREYVVTVKKYNDLDKFYSDMDNGIGGYIPARKAIVTNKRPISRNTNYLLTPEEAETLKQDPRVLNVELTLSEQNLRFKPAWVDTSSLWNKSSTVDNTYKNWGLLRVFRGAQINNWGTDNTPNATGTVTTVSTGKNVDVVIVDGFIDPDHPEFSVSSDGMGTSRVQQYNWYSLNPVVTGGNAGTYTYTPYIDGFNDSINNHGCLSAGVVAGNTCGWARDASIYNINPYTTDSSVFIDYVRTWHSAKTNGNPTIMCNNYELSVTVPLSDIDKVKFKGKLYSGLAGSVTDYQALVWGIPNDTVYATFPVRNTAIEQDLIDAINAGVIVIGSAGNNGAKIGTYSNNNFNDYNNYLELTNGMRYYYSRGTISAAVGVICVGAISALASETKRTDSCCGPRVDLYAPGTNIQSSSQIPSINMNAQDTRNTFYSLAKFSGTSAAASHVAGVIACWAEVNRKGSTTQAVSYLSVNSMYGQINDTKGGPLDSTDLQGSTNRYLRFYEPNIGGTVIDNYTLKDITISF